MKSKKTACFGTFHANKKNILPVVKNKKWKESTVVKT
jgi:hypothetical protein